MAYLMWLIPSLFAGVAIGATALTSRFSGASDSEATNRATNQAILLAMGLSIVVTISLWLGGGSVIHALQLEPEAAILATQYLRILVPFIPCIMLEQVGIACLRGIGDTVTGFAAMTVAMLW